MQKTTTSKQGRATSRTQGPPKTKVNSGTALRLYQLQSPEIAQTLAELHSSYGKYVIPVADLRKMMDKAMGEKTLTGELNAMREGS